MTNIQIEYHKARETQRHNVATEAQAKNELAETSRHNYAFERETKRHNVATEGETKRSNLANEGIKRDTLRETKRSNLAHESLTARDIANKERKTTSDIAVNRSTISKNQAAARKDTASAKQTEWLNDYRAKYPNSALAAELARGVPNDIAASIVAGTGMSADGIDWILGKADYLSQQDAKKMGSVYEYVTGKKAPAKFEAKDKRMAGKIAEIRKMLREMYNGTIGYTLSQSRR